jgi:hypothetical protein
MSDLDIPEGPKTPESIRRIMFLALGFALLIIYEDSLGIPFIGGIGEFGLDNLLMIGTIVGTALFVYKNRELIDSLLK